MRTTQYLSMSGSQAETLSNPKWSRHVQESFDLYRELDAVREQVHEVDTMQAIDECMGHLLLTLNTVFTELGSAPASTDQTELKMFTRQIARRLQAENRLVKDVIRNVLANDPNVLLVANPLPELSVNT